MNTPAPRTSLRKWLLRIFLGSFLLAVAAPVAIAVAVLHVSGDTRALRNAAIRAGGANWKKQIEVNVGSLPLWAARCVLPFTPAPEEARQALSAVRSVEFSLHESRNSAPDCARILRETDERMRKRGWDRVVGVLDGNNAVAVYALPEGGSAGDLRISVLVIDDRQMVAVTGRGRLQPLYDLAMDKVGNEFLAKHRRSEPIIAKMRD